VLVPALEGKSGSKVAEQVRKSIDKMATHVAIPEKEVKAALKKLGTKESEMDCLKYRQLMSHVDAKLVMCGAVDASGQVGAQFYNPDGTSYDVPPFAFTGEAAAAQQITQAFGAYNEMLRVLAFCDDYLGSQQWQDALNQCSKAAELNPKSSRALYAKGAAQRALEQHAEALATFQQVLELDPINQDAMLSAAIEASTLGQEEVSRRYLDSYLELNPGDANVRLSIASRVAKEGDFRSALAILEATEQTDTANAALREYAGHFAMGAAGKLVNAEGGEVPAAAKELFRKAIAHYSFLAASRPDSVGGAVLRNLMIAHAAVGNTDEALSWGQKAVAQPDVEAQTWSVYADQLRVAQRHQEALAALDKVAQLDPSSSVVGRRALILVDMNRLADATEALKQARARNQLTDEQVDGVAQRLIKTGYEDFQKVKKYEQAFKYYENARQIATSSKTRAMANYLQGYGMYEQARTIQEKSTVQSARQSLPIFQRARSLLQNSTAYSDGGAAEGRASLLKAIDQLIEIQNALINRG
jgi:tetratricopeptide (TPR) repeat protein